MLCGWVRKIGEIHENGVRGKHGVAFIKQEEGTTASPWSLPIANCDRHELTLYQPLQRFEPHVTQNLLQATCPVQYCSFRQINMLSFERPALRRVL